MNIQLEKIKIVITLWLNLIEGGGAASYLT